MRVIMEAIIRLKQSNLLQNMVLIINKLLMNDLDSKIHSKQITRIKDTIILNYLVLHLKKTKTTLKSLR